LVRNKNKLIKAAYAYSEELGKQVEALPKVMAKDAGLVYETVVSVLNASDRLFSSAPRAC
jgi:hypothetical protein